VQPDRHTRQQQPKERDCRGGVGEAARSPRTRGDYTQGARASDYSAHQFERLYQASRRRTVWSQGLACRKGELCAVEDLARVGAAHRIPPREVRQANRNRIVLVVRNPQTAKRIVNSLSAMSGPQRGTEDEREFPHARDSSHSPNPILQQRCASDAYAGPSPGSRAIPCSKRPSLPGRQSAASTNRAEKRPPPSISATIAIRLRIGTLLRTAGLYVG
jgi:hypothetical protein